MILNNYFKNIIYGGIDGIITMFNIIAGIKGGGLKYYVILIVGVAALFSDAVSMGFSSYLSEKAHNIFLRKNKRKNINENKDENEYLHGLTTFISFIIFGSIPLITYLLTKNINNSFMITVFSTVFSLFILGIFQSYYTEQKWYVASFSLIIYGLIAAFISYTIANKISKYLD